jgi:hypothetical protein
MQHHDAYGTPHYQRHYLKRNSSTTMAKHYQQRCCSSYDTRTRLLNRLGIFDVPQKNTLRKPTQPSPIKTVSTGRPTTCRPNRLSSLLGSVEPIHAKLNDSTEFSSSLLVEENASSESSACCAPSTTTTRTSNSSRVHFNETVSVVEIPSRYQYSDRIKKFIWSDRYELSENAERNVVEFAHEGYDWRNVVMDEDMYIDSINGTLMHPCHFLDSTTTTNDDKCGDYKSDDNDGFRPLARSDSRTQQKII